MNGLFCDVFRLSISLKVELSDADQIIIKKMKLLSLFLLAFAAANPTTTASVGTTAASEGTTAASGTTGTAASTDSTTEEPVDDVDDNDAESATAAATICALLLAAPHMLD